MRPEGTHKKSVTAGIVHDRFIGTSNNSWFWRCCLKLSERVQARAQVSPRSGAVLMPGWRPRAIEARGTTLRYLPKYSPDLNPIEMPFQQAQGPSAQGCRAHNSSPAPPNRQIRAYPHGPRSFQLFQARRLCVKSNGICSR
jgi:hypothetical protein